MGSDVNGPNPFETVCGVCGQRLNIHILRGRQARCNDQEVSDIPIWIVVAAKRALGHKINPAMSHAAWKAEAEHNKTHDSG